MIRKYCLFIIAMLLASSMGFVSCQDQAPQSSVVEIRGFSFQPASITVPAGAIVTWINRDPVVHTVTADNGSFDSGNIGSVEEFERTFSEPGTYRYHCTPHPSMIGEIVVTEAKTQTAAIPAAPVTASQGSASQTSLAPESIASMSMAPRIGLELVAEGFTAPLAFISAKDGTGRMFLVDQTGIIKIVGANGTVIDEPFLDVCDRMVELMTGFDERGLLGLAFHPDFAENGRVFVFYSAPLRPQAPAGWNATSHLSEFMISDNDPNKVNMTSERIILQVDKPQFNHNGGGIAFGPDGYLYVPLGDGGGADDVGPGHASDGNGQNTTTIQGKILRIDVNNMSKGMNYSIPDDNPFVGQAGILPEIYALGLRNPWRMAFDTVGNHELLVSDAGQNLWEEVDLVTAGGNYGWNIREGTHCFDTENPNESPASCPNESARGEPLINPVIEYGHDLGMTVVGGYIYRGHELPEMNGKYIFADWSNNFTRGNGTLLMATPSSEGLWSWEEIEVATNPSSRVDAFIRSFGLDDDGEIYVLTSDVAGPTNETGKIFKMVPA
jgi:glucose/arabinose dehydrogenase